MNTRLKKLMKELGEAINGTLSESEQIAQVIAKIGFNRRDEETAPISPELVSMRRKNAEPEFSVNANDVRFLKSLRISVDEAA